MKLINKLINWLTNRRIKYVISQIGEYKNIDGWLTEREAYGLFLFAKKVKRNGIIVEIGSWKGKSTYCLAKGLRNGKLYAIDPFNAEGEPDSRKIYEETKGQIPLIEQFKTTMSHFRLLDKIEILEGYSHQFVSNFIKIDLLFIDGNHSIEGCDYDYLNYSSKIRKGGYVAFHDYDPDRSELGPTWVIQNRIKNNDTFKFIKQFDTLWIAQKI